MKLGQNALARLNRVEAMKVQLAQEELTAIGTFLEEYSETAKLYPGETGAIAKLPDKLRGWLDDGDIVRLPTNDPWGESYRYWTDGGEYFIVTTGPDREPGTDYSQVTKPRLERKKLCLNGDDLVFYNGRLCR